MGDRRQCVLRFTMPRGEVSDIFFYSHWRGYDMPHDIAAALAKSDVEGRLLDSEYCTRIVLRELTSKNAESCGISPYNIESEYNSFVLDMERGMVYLEAYTPDAPKGHFTVYYTPEVDPEHAWTFGEFIGLSSAELARLSSDYAWYH